MELDCYHKAQAYVCKIASMEELNRKWDYEIAQNPGDGNWLIWKEEAVENFQKGVSIPYYGILNGTIICEATAVTDPQCVQNSEGMMEKGTVYLCAFRTNAEYQEQGYFSKLKDFMLEDLRKRGFTKAILGVAVADDWHQKMYEHWGFTEYLKTGEETYPDGTIIDVEYYGKKLLSIVEKMRQEIVRRSDLFEAQTKGTKDEYNLYREHVQYVYKYAVMLSKDAAVDKEIVELSALLHDVSMTDPSLDRSKHNEYGSAMAEQLLREQHYSEEKLQLVAKCILNHGSKRAQYRTTREEDLLACADGLAHFDAYKSLYSLAHKVMGLDDEQSLKFIQDKLTKDYAEISEELKYLVSEIYARVMEAKTIQEILEPSGECKAIRQLFVGFKGKKNLSAILVSALSSQPCLLTNSFEGLKKEIEDLPPDYDKVWLFGVDKNLETSVRIERVAKKDGMRRSTKLDAEDLAARFSGVGLKAIVASDPTEYLCNEAYWHLLGKYDGKAVLIHVPTVKHFDEKWISKIKQIERNPAVER